MAAQINDVLTRLAFDNDLCAAVLEDDIGDQPLMSLTKVLVDARTILPLVRDQVQLEFMQHSTERDAILRGNCVATRLMSSYCSLVGSAWVRKSLRSSVKRLLRLPEMWLLDVSKVSSGSAQEKKELCEASHKSLLSLATAFLQKMRVALAQVPREIRCMAYFVWIQARTFCPDRATALLGGFVFLRILNPALVSPEQTEGLVPQGSDIPTGFKQNCIALCRLLQNLSNQKRYPESAGMPLLNEWLEQNNEPLECYLLDLATDNLIEEGRRPFAELLGAVERPKTPPPLRHVLSDEEWAALHVALVKCKTHVMVRTTLAPVLGSSKSVSPRQSPASGSSGSSSVSMPASPVRSRSGSARFQGNNEGEELAIYGDGKMRLRTTGRRGSMSSGTLFSKVGATSSSPNLLQNSIPARELSNSSPGSVPSSAASSVGAGSPPSFFRSASGSFSGSLNRSPSLSSNPGSPVRVMASHRARSRAGSSAGNSGATSPRLRCEEPMSPGSGSSERLFFVLLESIPLPAPARLEHFILSLAPIQRSALVTEGLLHESGSRRLSTKLGSPQVELLLRIAIALRHVEFGIKVESCALPLLIEWFAQWLHVDQSKEVDHLVSLMVRNSFVSEKGSKSAKGYVLESSHIAEMSRLFKLS